MRIRKYIPLEEIVVPDGSFAKNVSSKERKVQEGKLLLNKISADEWVVLLDEKGKSFNSKGFASYLEQKTIYGPKSLVFVIGGAFGFSDDIYTRANEKIRLSDMTFFTSIDTVDSC